MLLAVVSQSQTQETSSANKSKPAMDSVQSKNGSGLINKSGKHDSKQALAVNVALATPSSHLKTDANHQPSIQSHSMELNADELLTLRTRLNKRLVADQEDYEASLLNSIVSFQLGETQSAIDELTQLAQKAPEFHLAHLVRADFLASHFSSNTDIGNPELLEPAKGVNEKLIALRHEAQMRILANVKPQAVDKVPLQLLNMSNKTQTALVVDKSRHRIYVFQRESANAPAKLIRDFYVSTGRKQGNKKIEGDLRTPEGVYFITSWIPDSELPEKYGMGAFPTNYPNALDRKLGKTGDGIWLHGTDRIYYSRPPLDSEGCVVLSNLDLKKISHLIKPGQTPMIITDKIEWVDEQQWNQVRSQVLKSIERWRLDWESLDVDRYLSHYADEFWSGRHDIHSWREYKSRVAKQKTYQKIGLGELSLFYYPEQASSGKPMVVARFIQKYQSNNYKGEVRKRIYLGKEEDNWRILYEGR